jgi:hypothetical protein
VSCMIVGGTGVLCAQHRPIMFPKKQAEEKYDIKCASTTFGPKILSKHCAFSDSDKKKVSLSPPNHTKKSLTILAKALN